MKKSSLSALAAAGLLAGGLPTTNAFAADLGGNCCADLEERVAELEARTVRKGNRKFSLPITGLTETPSTGVPGGSTSALRAGVLPAGVVPAGPDERAASFPARHSSARELAEAPWHKSHGPPQGPYVLTAR